MIVRMHGENLKLADTKFGRNTRELCNILKHGANISALGSRKRTKYYHTRRCDLTTLYEDEDPTWRHYSYSEIKKKYLLDYVILTDTLILRDSQPCQ